MVRLANPSILLIGCGNMGFAMLKGWADSGLSATITVLDPHTNPLEKLNRPNSSNNLHYVKLFKKLNQEKPFNIIVLAIKPQSFSEVKSELGALITPRTLVLSIMAGITSDKILNINDKISFPVVRAMPNLPALVGQGITACFSPAAIDKTVIEELLKPLGETLWLEDESQMDAVTALSGSGPGYLFYLAQALSESGAALGLPQPVAEKLARQTLIGTAGVLKDQAATPPHILREQVTSKGGTTEAGLEVLMHPQTGLKPLMEKTLAAATQRSRDLSQS
jgi:pyrroline-5-carboxylate reductase